MVSLEVREEEVATFVISASLGIQEDRIGLVARLVIAFPDRIYAFERMTRCPVLDRTNVVAMATRKGILGSPSPRGVNAQGVSLVYG